MSVKQLCLTAAAITAISTHAISLQYEVGSGSAVVAHSSGPGLLIETELATGLANQAFTLNDGQSYTFDFFKIWTDETDVNIGEDTEQRPITATLDFDVPDLDAQVQGITFGGNLMLQAGIVVWNDPVIINAGARTFSVNLNNAVFDLGWFKLGNHAATITATVKQISSGGATTTPPPTSVPDAGSTMTLLGLGLTAMALVQRRLASRRTAA